MPSRWTHIRNLKDAVGSLTALRILTLRALGSASPIEVSAGGRRVVLRPADSDLFVVGQIFGRREYDPGRVRTAALNRLAAGWIAAGQTPVVIDGGANVGYSSLFLADLFPTARVLAVEPMAETFGVLRRNCTTRERIDPVHAALWSHDDGVAIDAPNDAGSWAARVDGAGSTPSRTIESLLADIPGARLLAVKLDIEGAEREVCRHSSDVIGQAPCILIEPHDFMNAGAACLSALHREIGKHQFDTIVNGENLQFFASYLADAGAAGATP